MQGLEQQLLAELVRAERPELEEMRDSLITSISVDKRQLQQLENKILQLLREATGNLLDDETLISTLNVSKETAGTTTSHHWCDHRAKSCFVGAHVFKLRLKRPARTAWLGRGMLTLYAAYFMSGP